MQAAWIEDEFLCTESTCDKIGLGPLITLIRQVHARYPENARSILRRPIFTNYDISAAEWGVLKVCAKRTKQVSHRPDLHALPSLSAFDRLIDFDQNLSPMALALRLAELADTSSPHLYLRDRKIAAVLTDSSGKILAAARHLGSLNRTLHAEMNLAEGFVQKTQKKFPAGAKVYLTLKPCKMCAGALLAACEEPASLQVFYFEDDLGPLADNTALEAESFARCFFFEVGSAEYKKHQVFKYLAL